MIKRLLDYVDSARGNPWRLAYLVVAAISIGTVIGFAAGYLLLHEGALLFMAACCFGIVVLVFWPFGRKGR